jgi:hypothetical protein
MSQAASSMPSPVPSPSGLPGDSKPEIVTGYDDKGFTTLKTVYPGTTPPATTVGRLQNNAAETKAPSAPVAGNSGARPFDGIGFQLFTVVFSIMCRQAW